MIGFGIVRAYNNLCACAIREHEWCLKKNNNNKKVVDDNYEGGIHPEFVEFCLIYFSSLVSNVLLSVSFLCFFFFLTINSTNGSDSLNNL